jgi:nucleoside-diphosphate-sugar epimerase
MGVKGLQVDDAEFVKGDVRDIDALAQVFRGATEVYHLAAVLGTSELQESQQEAIEVNIGGTVSVLEAANRCSVQRLFYPSKPNVWSNTYTLTKVAAESFVHMWNQTGTTRISSLRYFNAYGPGQAPRPIKKIIPAFAVQAMYGLPIEIYGDGTQVVDMVYSKDLAELTVRFTRGEFTDRIPDCGSGVSVTVNEVAASVNEFFGSEAGVRYLPMRPGESEHTTLTADNSELERTLGDLHLTDYRDALKTTLEWYSTLPAEEIARTAKYFGWSA